jgi:hypothetical protein
VRLDASLSPGSATEVVLSLRGATLAYDRLKHEIVVNGHRAPAPLTDGRLVLTVFIDRTTIEVFAGGGLTYVPLPFIARPDDRSLTAAATGGEAVLDAIAVRTIDPIWPAPDQPAAGAR